MDNVIEVASLLKAHFSRKSENPFIGLRPFEAEESHLFFGRDKQIRDLLQNLHSNHFLAIVGSSGCGKSSLIRAGVIPKLKGGFLTEKRDYWLIATMRPSGDPLFHLSRSLLDAFKEDEDLSSVRKRLTPDAIKELGVSEFIQTMHAALDNRRVNLLILVDQFEELFTYKINTEKQKNENNYFINLLLGLANENSLPVYTIITMRSDYIGHCNRFFGLPELLNESQYLVPKLRWQQIREVIEYPIKLYNQNINPGLLDLLSNDSDKELDQLPVLQHCMMRTYQNWIADRKKGLIEFKHYEETGGLNGAIRKHANAVYEELDPTEQKTCEYLFRAISDHNADYEPVRRPQQFINIVNICSAVEGSSRQTVLNVINKFRNKSCAFLTPYEDAGDITDNTVIDISHESLMRQWDKLKEWIDIEQRSSDKLHWLSDSVKNKREYLRGLDVKDALAWKQKQNPNEDWAHRYVDNLPGVLTYISKSKRNDKRRRLLLYGSIFLITFSILTAGFFVAKAQVRQHEAEDERNFILNTTELNKILAQRREDSTTTAIKLAQEKAKEDSIRGELNLRLAQFKIREASSKNKALEISIEKTKRIKDTAMAQVLDLTNEMFYKSPEITDSVKRKAVLELIKMRYEERKEAEYQTYLNALNKGAKALEIAKENPNGGLWKARQAYQMSKRPIFDSIFRYLLNQYWFNTKKAEFAKPTDNELSLDQLKASISKNGNMFAYTENGSINVIKIQEDSIYLLPEFFTHPGGIMDDYEEIKKLVFKNDNTLIGLIDDSIYHWNNRGELLSTKVATPPSNYEIKTISSDASRIFYANQQEDTLRILNNLDNSWDIFGSKKSFNTDEMKLAPNGQMILYRDSSGMRIRESTKSTGTFLRGYQQGTFVNDEQVILYNFSGNQITLLNIKPKRVTRMIDISSLLGRNEEVSDIQLSSDWKKLLVSVINVDELTNYFLLLEKKNSDSIFKLNVTFNFLQYQPYSSAKLNASGFVIRRVPAIALGFVNNNQVASFKSNGNNFSISLWGKNNDRVAINTNTLLMPSLSFEDMLRYDVIDVTSIKDEASLSRAAEFCDSIFQETDDSSALLNAYSAYKILIEKYDGIKYRSGFREAVYNFFEDDTIWYCNNLKLMTRIGETALRSGTTDEDPDEIKVDLANDYDLLARLSIYSFNTNYDSVLRYVLRSVQLDPYKDSDQTTLVPLAYLLAGKYKEADRAYIKAKERGSPSHITFDRVSDNHFGKLENMGIIKKNTELYRRVEKIKKYLKSGEIKDLD